ncbi:MAG: hypothetical protein AB7P76_00970 [Candidatus Melainabacteria bacterium]
MDALRIVAVVSSEETRAVLLQQLQALPFAEFDGVYIELSEAVRKCQTFHPDVIIVELTGRELDAGLFMQAIAMNPEHPCVLYALHRQMELDIFKEAIKQGAREFIHYPEDKQSLETALKKHMAFLSRVARQPRHHEIVGAAEKKGQLITVFSSKGGNGASTIAVNTAHALQTLQQQPTVYFDLDQFYCNSGVMLNLKPEFALGDLSQNNSDEVDSDLVKKITLHHDSGMNVIVGSKSILDENDMIPPEMLSAVLDILVSEYAYVVVDLPSHFLDPYHQYMVERSDLLLLVACPDIPSLYRTRQYLDLAQKYLDIQKVKLVLNRFDLKAAYGIKNEQLEEEFRHDIFSRIANDWEINVEANSVGALVANLNPKAKMVRDIQQLARQICGDNSETAGVEAAGEEGLLGKLFGKKETQGTKLNVFGEAK